MELREFIAERRKKLGLSQGDLGSAMGYTDTAISKIESGMSSPPVSVLPLFANKLQISLNDLLLKREPTVPFAGKNPPYVPEVMGRNLRAIRLHLHLRQSEAAVKLGVSKRTIITYEKGNACPYLDVLESILPYCTDTPADFFYGTLYPEIQVSSGFRRRGPNPYFLFGLGLVVGGAVISSILYPVLRGGASSSGQGSYTGSFSAPTSSESASSTFGILESESSLSDFDYLKTQLAVIGEDGIALDAAMKPNSTLKITVFTGLFYSENMRSKTVFLFGWDKDSMPPSGTIMTETEPAPCHLITTVNAPLGSVFTVTIQAYLKSDPQNIITGVPLNITVNDNGSIA
jgi:transcriptional regulator with XRE-family HTH domain